MEIERKKTYVLFYIGSMRSYVTNNFASEFGRKIEPFDVGLGGVSRETKKYVLLICSIESLKFDIEANIVKNLGF